MSIDTATHEGRVKRQQQLIDEHISKSKRKGDYHHNAAVALGAHDDYIPGVDDGEPPAGMEREWMGLQATN